jgi:hypothetical protein
LQGACLLWGEHALSLKLARGPRKDDQNENVDKEGQAFNGTLPQKSASQGHEISKARKMQLRIRNSGRANGNRRLRLQ